MPESLTDVGTEGQNGGGLDMTGVMSLSVRNFVLSGVMPLAECYAAESANFYAGEAVKIFVWKGPAREVEPRLSINFSPECT
ncbi:MAG: hypothetical protein LBQ00_09530 [Syntrophobacterales bacterium]|nr:hypothetical protein [Syntrophobacterales bacterium]